MKKSKRVVRAAQDAALAAKHGVSQLEMPPRFPGVTRQEQRRMFREDVKVWRSSLRAKRK